MLKTIKVKKKLRIDELIKYVIDKGLNSFQFTSDNNVGVYFSSNGYFLIAGDGSGNEGSRSFELSDTFTVEVEEEITEDTVFKSVLGVLGNGEMAVTNLYNSVSGMKKRHGSMQEVHAVINGKLELIWEAESDV